MVERLPDVGGFGAKAGYSRAVRNGQFIAVSATAALDDGAVVHGGDAYAQTRLVLERALAAARELGAEVGDVVRTRLLLAPDCDWRDAVRAHSEMFVNEPPANTTYYVGRLIPDGALVEVELDALVPEVDPATSSTRTDRSERATSMIEALRSGDRSRLPRFPK